MVHEPKRTYSRVDTVVFQIKDWHQHIIGGALMVLLMAVNDGCNIFKSYMSYKMIPEILFPFGRAPETPTFFTNFASITLKTVLMAEKTY